MKILAIRIKNLASLEGTTDLSFTQEPLCSAGIFAITGPTGAGKSTILDALCLALYAQTPRYDKSNDPNQGILDIAGNTITQSDPRKILRDGAADGYAEVDFEGVDGHRHRAQWAVRRARNKIEGALQPYQLSCRNLDTNTDEQGTKSEVLASISRKVGLSFEQFTRAVLLPQGDFTAFLKAPNTEKSELLEKLTGTQIYSEISKRIFERHRMEKEELNVLSVQKEGIFILDEQQTEALNKRLEELLHLSTQQQKNEETLARELIWHERLANFQKTLAESRQAFALADTRKKETTEREIKLAQVEQVQPVRVWVQGLAGQQEVFTTKLAKQKNVEQELLQWQEQQTTQNELLETASQQLDLKIKEQEQCQPLLDQAKQLDTQLKDQLKILEVKQVEWQQAKETLGVQEKEIQQQQQQLQELHKSVEMLEAYVTKNQTRRPLAENEKLIVKTLVEAQVTLQEEKSALEEIKRAEKELGKKQAAEKVQTEKLVLMKEAEKKQADIYTNAQKLISAIDGKALQQNKNDADAKLLETTQAVGDWKALSEMTAFLEKDKVIVKKSKAELEEGTKQIQILTKELPVIQTRKESAYHAFEMARQESSADVVSLREQLVQDQECPVCGSKEHPYVKHDPTVEKVLARLEADYKQQEKAHQEALIQQSALQEKIRQLGKEIENLSIQQKDKEGKIKEYRKSWIHFSLHSEAENRTAGEVDGWLKLQQKEHKAKQKKWQQELDQWQEQQRELEQHRKEHEKLTEQGRVAENVLKDLHRNIESQKEKLAQAQKENSKAAKRLTQTQESLTIYFTNKDWFDKWKEDADKFIQQITQFSSDWKTNLEKLDKSKQEKEIRETAIKGEQNKLQVLVADANKKEADAAAMRQQHQALLDARKQLFEGRSVEVVEKKLKDAVTKAREDLEQNKVQLEQIQNSITRSITQREEIQQEMERLTGEITRLDQKIIQWLETYNTTSATHLERKEMEALLILPENWIEKERRELQQVKNILLQAQTLMQEHQKMLDKHLEQPLSERPMEMVTEQLAVIRTELKETHREDAEIKLRFKQDGENRQKAGALLEQITAKEILVNNWGMLNQVIGSADGKKFRQVAQEYTLDVLLGYTNVHLDMLSKRYLLERTPGSLGLQVIDQDMGNEVRTVNSLSGGESFLVSLALALGLASLSSSRMQVESLFIDEGFGSLDPATLNIAMDALERLHNQGRKVGVISHVQEMTERIPVQIKVSKQQSGRSKVEVIGF